MARAGAARAGAPPARRAAGSRSFPPRRSGRAPRWQGQLGHVGGGRAGIVRQVGSGPDVRHWPRPNRREGPGFACRHRAWRLSRRRLRPTEGRMTKRVPLASRLPGRLPACRRVALAPVCVNIADGARPCRPPPLPRRPDAGPRQAGRAAGACRAERVAPTYRDARRAELRPAAPPELAHRLDKDTSGCPSSVATPRPWRGSGRCSRRAGSPTYWAIVEGGPVAEAEGIDMALARRSPERGWWMRPDPAGQAAATRFRVLGRAAGLCWLELMPETGRTHQLRVHCAASGYPILGDAVYGTAQRFSGRSPDAACPRRLGAALSEEEPRRRRGGGTDCDEGMPGQAGAPLLSRTEHLG